jgi:hypothetical protein
MGIIEFVDSFQSVCLEIPRSISSGLFFALWNFQLLKRNLF